MKKKVFFSLMAFAIFLLLHASYSVWTSQKLAARWSELPGTNYIALYFGRGEYFIGASYALTIGFSVYALMSFLENRKRGVAGIIGGITLTGVLYVAGCFLIGCCGSPMLAVYLTLFGSSFLGFAKPLTFILTVASIVVGFMWIRRNSISAANCCEGEEECKRT
ncbi:MAG: hypothetical protein ACHQQQ_06010 [Bacteroidota bacterium]